MLAAPLPLRRGRCRPTASQISTRSNLNSISGPRIALRGDHHGRQREDEAAIWDCQKDIAAYLPDESGISEHELVQMLIARLDGSQAKEALGGDWQGWWPDDDGGGSPAAQNREMA